jgi:putative RecB family exonuclease
MLKLSVSGMDTYKKCPKQYHYRYVERTEVEKEKHAWTEFGTCAHLVLEYFHNEVNLETPKSDWARIMKECFVRAVKEFPYADINQMQSTPDNKQRMGLEYLKDIIQEYLGVLRKEGLPNVLGNEIAYSFEIQKDVIIRGYIDRVDVVDDTTLRVVDYKTSKSPKYLKDFQLLVYAVALKEKYPHIEKVYGDFLLLKHGSKRKSFVFRDFDIEKCYDLIKDNVEMIETDTHWVQKPSPLCKYCDYRKICSAYGRSSVKFGEEKWV